jgi:hypothetical protein
VAVVPKAPSVVANISQECEVCKSKKGHPLTKCKKFLQVPISRIYISAKKFVGKICNLLVVMDKI